MSDGQELRIDIVDSANTLLFTSTVGDGANTLAASFLATGTYYAVVYSSGGIGPSSTEFNPVYAFKLELTATPTQVPYFYTGPYGLNGSSYADTTSTANDVYVLNNIDAVWNLDRTLLISRWVNGSVVSTSTLPAPFYTPGSGVWYFCVSSTYAYVMGLNGDIYRQPLAEFGTGYWELHLTAVEVAVMVQTLVPALYDVNFANECLITKDDVIFLKSLDPDLLILKVNADKTFSGPSYPVDTNSSFYNSRLQWKDANKDYVCAVCYQDYDMYWPDAPWLGTPTAGLYLYDGPGNSFNLIHPSVLAPTIDPPNVVYFNSVRDVAVIDPENMIFLSMASPEAIWPQPHSAQDVVIIRLVNGVFQTPELVYQYNDPSFNGQEPYALIGESMTRFHTLLDNWANNALIDNVSLSYVRDYSGTPTVVPGLSIDSWQPPDLNGVAQPIVMRFLGVALPHSTDLLSTFNVRPDGSPMWPSANGAWRCNIRSLPDGTFIQSYATAKNSTPAGGGGE
jgi:hypothetical protein